jgi:hypothetical protein
MQCLIATKNSQIRNAMLTRDMWGYDSTLIHIASLMSLHWLNPKTGVHRAAGALMS